MKRTRTTLTLQEKIDIVDLVDSYSNHLDSVSLYQLLQDFLPGLHRKLFHDGAEGLKSTFRQLPLWKVQAKIAKAYDLTSTRIEKDVAARAYLDHVIDIVEYCSLVPESPPSVKSNSQIRQKKPANRTDRSDKRGPWRADPYFANVKKKEYFDKGSFCVSPHNLLSIIRSEEVILCFGEHQKAIDIDNYKYYEKEDGLGDHYYIFYPKRS